MRVVTPEHLIIGTGDASRSIAYLHRPGRTPGLFWLGGYRSEMTGSKATALDMLGEQRGLEVTRFDSSSQREIVPSRKSPPDLPCPE